MLSHNLACRFLPSVFGVNKQGTAGCIDPHSSNSSTSDPLSPVTPLVSH